jgi:tetratricopeptide (TPR) repeat protein
MRLLLAAWLLVQAALSVEPDWTQAKTALDLGHFEEAKQLILNALPSHPNDPALWFYLGASYNGLNQLDLAIDAFEKAHKLAPNQAQVSFDLGLIYWRKGNIGKAKEAYSRGLAQDLSDQEAFQNYALLLMKTGESENAIDPLLRLKKLDSASLSTRVSLIECYLKTRNRPAAVLETNDLLQSHLAGFEEQTKLGAILIEDGDLELAETVLRNSLRLNSVQPKAYAALGLVFLNQKRFKDAAGSFETAVHLKPGSAEYAMAFANSLVLWNRPNTLLAFLNSVEKQFGDLSEFRHKLAFAYYGIGEFSKAVDVLKELLRTYPQRQDQIYFLVASSYFGMGKLEESENAFRKAIELNPKEPLYYESYATLLRKQGSARIDDALAELKQAAQLAPQDPPLLCQIGLSYESKGDVKEAVGPLEAAVRGDPESLPARVALARVYFRLGRKTEGETEKKSVAELEAKLQKLRSDPKDKPEAVSQLPAADEQH